MSNEQPTGLRRRHWLIAAPAGLLAVGAVARWWSNRAPVPTSEPSPFASLTPGTQLDRWTIVRVHALHLGAVPVVLATADGRRYQVDVLARDPQGPSGVASTEHLSLFVVNSRDVPGDDGRRRTDEEQGLGAMLLAEALAREATPSGMLTLTERRHQHPRGTFGVPLV